MSKSRANLRADKVKQKEKMDKKELLRYYYQSYTDVLKRSGINYLDNPVNDLKYHKKILKVNAIMDYHLKD